MFLHSRIARKGLVPALLLACAACAPQTGGPTQIAPVAASAPWWRQSGDALLDEMTAQALEAMPPVCVAPRRGIGRVLHPQSAQKRHAQERDRAAQRLEKAEAVAQAYLRLRSWQERLAARHAMLAPWADNAEIAHFRREAGLVPALDEDMAGVMVGLNGADEDAARAGFERALGDLARLTGQDAASLRARLDKTSAMPIGNGPSPQANALLAKAEAALAYARIAYRGGAASFATLYVAEANALAAREAQIMAAHAAALATIRQWSEKSMGEEAHCG
jgi:outer membrane protein TolC